MKHLTPASILTIAGSDSSGGAGIQADLKTIEALGGYGMSAITALTAQNTQGVQGIHPVPPAFVAQQITSVMTDIQIAAVKTGMLANSEIVAAIADALAPFWPQSDHDAQSGIQLVIDPVMVAKGGATLLDIEAITTLKTVLLPMATIITPNIPEAELLCGMPVTTLEQMKQAAIMLVEMGANAVLVKGGHLDTSDIVSNVLVTNSGDYQQLISKRIATRHTHGTGCTLSAAIATYLGLGESLTNACKKAEAYVTGAITHAPDIGSGHGPLLHRWMTM